MSVRERQLEYLASARNLRAQEKTVTSLAAAKAQAGKRLAQVTSRYRSELQNERVEAEGQSHRLQQESVKLGHQAARLELKAPQAGIVKELATHTIGAVVSPGAALLTLVPEDEPLLAEVMIQNKARAAPASQELEARGQTHRLVPGMQVVAEIHQRRRTVMEYLLSPVQKTLHEGGRER